MNLPRGALLVGNNFHRKCRFSRHPELDSGSFVSPTKLFYSCSFVPVGWGKNRFYFSPAAELPARLIFMTTDFEMG